MGLMLTNVFKKFKRDEPLEQLQMEDFQKVMLVQILTHWLKREH